MVGRTAVRGAGVGGMGSVECGDGTMVGMEGQRKRRHRRAAPGDWYFKFR